jgi:hypothetical protein
MSVVQAFRSGRRTRNSQYLLTKAVIEALESRLLLTTTYYNVNSLADNGSTVNQSTAHCELRWAINQIDATGGTNEITFGSGLSGTIYLTQGDLELTNGNTTISGPGASVLTVNAGGLFGDVFSIQFGSTAAISGLTISGGHGGDSNNSGYGGGIDNQSSLTITNCFITGNNAQYGGGISNQGVLTVTNCIISGNTASSQGGGLYTSGTATITDSTITDNSATSNGGGGISNDGNLTILASTISGNHGHGDGGGIVNNSKSSLSVTNSTLSGNTVSGKGGGIYTASYASTIVTDSTLSGNTASNKGGGIWVGSYGSATVTDSTLSGNTASSKGGGIYDNSYGTLGMTNSTLRGNSAGIDGGGIFLVTGGARAYSGDGTSTVTITDSTLSGNSASTSGGGIFRQDATGTVTLNSTIVANSIPSDLIGAFSGTYNLIGDGTGGLSTASSSHNILNVNPDLTPLGNYGGPTQTMALLPQSPAIGGGSSFGLSSDQRGLARSSSTGYDIGAFQTQPLVVNTTFDGAVGSNQLSLREAVNLADALGGDQTITFASSLTSGGPATIDLNGSLGSLILNDTTGTLTIDGPGVGLLSISGQNAIRDIQAYGSSEIENLTVTGGYASGGGNTSGGIDVESGATLTIHDATISGNTGNYGGGINNNGTLTITNSTISGNTAGNFGGGVYNNGLLNISNSTLSGNVAFNGGAIENYYGGSTTLVNSTISGNTAHSGGGIWNNGSSLALTDCTLADNVATVANHGGGIDGGATLYGTIVAGNSNKDIAFGTCIGTYNLVGDGTGGLSTASSSYNILNFNPDLTPLGNYGGPTQTMALLPQSPAIGANTGFSGVTSDQRGFARPTSYADIGAFETQPIPLVVNTISDDPIGPNQLSLRDAINLADAMGGNQRISFATSLTANGPATINLTAGLGALHTNDPVGTLTIDGPGSSLLSINAEGHSGVFNIGGGGTTAISGLTITGGSDNNGGGIFVTSTLNISNSVITGNTANLGGGIDTEVGVTTVTNCTISGNNGERGGGIASFDNNTLNITGSVISGNTAESSGGGIFSYSTTTITDSTISGNHTTGTSGSGGGIYDYSGSALSLYDSTLSGNSSVFGGGIEVNGGTTTITNSTLSGNSASQQGGGIYNAPSGTLIVTDSTLSGNSAATNGGGGIYNYNSSATLNGTIVAGSSTHGGALKGTFSGTHNLIDDNSGSGLASSSSDNLLNTPALLSGLGNYGGSTETMIPLTGSLALMAGAAFDNPNGSPITTDQRGATRPANSNSDIGAVQGVLNEVFPLVVTTIDDDPVGSGFVSLRDAIATAEAMGGSQTITFAPSLTASGPATINLSSSDGVLNLDDTSGTLTIQGPGSGLMKINATGLPHAFSVLGSAVITGLTIEDADNTASGSAGAGGDILNNGTLTIANSTLSGAHSRVGAAVANYDSLTLNQCTITGNSATTSGGGVYSADYTTFTGNDCTFSDNSSPSGAGIYTRGSGIIENNSLVETGSATLGGGIENAGSLVVENSTVTDNSSFSTGGNIDNTGTIRLFNDTVSDNTSATLGGGIFSNNSLTIFNSTITGNTASNEGGAIYNTGAMTIDDSNINGNSATVGGGGIAQSEAGFASINNSYLTSNVTTASADTQGGGIFNIGTMNLYASTLSSNSTKNYGGGIFNSGDLTIANSTLTGDTTAYSAPGYGQYYGGGAIYNSKLGNLTASGTTFFDDKGAYGGAIENMGNSPSDNVEPIGNHCTITNCTFNQNFGKNAGGAIFNAAGGASVTDSTFTQNTTTPIQDTGGGAICDWVNGVMTIANSTLTGNIATNGSGGAIYDIQGGFGSMAVSYCTISDNSAGAGGGINSSSSQCTVSNSLISGNTANSGGGVFSNAEISISDCIITGNQAGAAGGLYCDISGTVTDTTFSDNIAHAPDASDNGGAILVNGEIVIANCTIGGNTAAKGGGIFNHSEYNGTSSFTLVDSTISGNSASSGAGGLYSYYDAHSASSNLLEGNIIAANTGGDIGLGSTATPFSGTNNLIGDGSGGLSASDSNILGTTGDPKNPLLAPLGNYGGPTAGAGAGQTVPTMALLPGSPAFGTSIIFDTPGTHNPINTDQRGISRPTGTAPDIGAFESQGFVVTTTNGSGAQSAATDHAFSNLQIHVTSNDPGVTQADLAGGVISFVAPNSGATTALGTNSVILDSSGDGTVTASANNTPGSYIVTASPTPQAPPTQTPPIVGTEAKFALTNTGTSAVLPTLSISGASSVNQNTNYTLNLITSDPTQSIGLTWTIVWGDGTPNTIISENNNALSPVTHPFASAPENYTITATAVDTDANNYTAGSQSVQVNSYTVSSPPPGVTATVESADLVDLAWNPVADAEFYQVYGGATANFNPDFEHLLGDGLPTPSFQDDSAAAGSTVYYQVFAVTSLGTSSFVGEAGPLIMPDAVMPNAPPAAPTNVQAVGINDLELFVSWNMPSVNNVTSYNVQISTDQTNWHLAGIAEPDATNFIVRTTDLSGLNDFLQPGVPYYIRIQAVGTGNNVPVLTSAWSAAATSASTVPPHFNNTIIIAGGNDQRITYLLQGLQVVNGDIKGTLGVTGNSVGHIWYVLEQLGYNVFITADPHDGGDGTIGGVELSPPVVEPGGAGQLYDELQQEITRESAMGNIANIAMVGYSHGAGIIYNMSTLLYNDPIASQCLLVAADTIDGVQYDPYADSLWNQTGYYDPNPLQFSPAEAWDGIGENYYETKGYFYFNPTTSLGVWLPIHGMPMFATSNHSEDPQNLSHSSIAIFPPVLTDVEDDMITAFGGIQWL